MVLQSAFEKRSLLWSLFLFLTIGSHGQNFDWAQNIGGLGLDVGRAVTTDNNGNVFVAGSFTGGAHIGGTYLTGYGSLEGFVAKFTSDGEFLWANVISGPAEDLARGLETDEYGNVYVVGHFTDTVVFHVSETDTVSAGSEGQQDVFVAKYDSDGNLLWNLTGGGLGNDTGTDLGYFRYSGKMYVSGGFEKRAKFGTATILSNGLTDAFLLKIDLDGNAHWIEKGGGLEHDIAASIAVDQTDESVYITGDFYDQAEFSGETLQALGSSDMFLAKYNSDGELQWVKTNGGTTVDVATNIGTDLNGNVYVSGYYQGTTFFQNQSASALSYNDVFLAQFSADDGTCNWLSSAGSWGLDNCLGMAVDWDGSTYLTGMFEEELITPTESTIGNGYDIYVLAYHPSGDVRYVRSAGAASSDFGMATCIGPDQSLYLTGYYFYFADFDATTIGPAENGDGFLARMTDILGVESQQQEHQTECLNFDFENECFYSTCEENGRWELVNLAGQTIESGALKKVNQLPSGFRGVSILTVTTEQTKFTKKLVNLTE